MYAGREAPLPANGRHFVQHFFKFDVRYQGRLALMDHHIALAGRVVMREDMTPNFPTAR